MKFTIEREALLKPLQLVAGIVEPRQTIPVLSNVLINLSQHELVLIGTDLQLELQGRVKLTEAATPGSITAPARKFVDICRALPEGAMLDIFLDGAKLVIRSGRSRFTLGTLPASEFPNTAEVLGELEFSVPKTELAKLLQNTSFAMAQQDVRHYLNGMLLAAGDGNLRCVATDGHRLALSHMDAQTSHAAQVIVPRKSVLELSRLLADTEGTINIGLNSSQLCIKTADYTFTSRLIDGQFPNHELLTPKGGENILCIDRDTLKRALSHVAILANEKHRGVQFELNPGLLRIHTNSPDQEGAEEELGVDDYQGDKLEMAFNVNYLIDVINALPAGKIQLTFSDPDSSVRVEEVNTGNSLYVIMPMRM